MIKLNQEIEQIMTERFGKDTILALATVENGIPCVRNVDAYYEDGAFYIITYALSNKMRQIADNQAIANKLKRAFAAWIDNGHNNFEDENTIILRVELTDGLLFSQGTGYSF